MFGVVLLLAFLMMAGGGAATFRGADILLADRGLPMVIAGATVASAGMILLGIAVAILALRRVERRLVQIEAGLSEQRAANLVSVARLPEGAGRAVPMGAEATTLDRGSAGPEAIDAEPGPAADTTEEGAALVVPETPAVTVGRPAPAAETDGIVGRYESGGNTYTMYASGSIVADTPTGQRRFASLDDLKAFVSGGGESR